MDKKILVVLFLLIGAALVAMWLRGTFSAPVQTGVRVRIGNSEYQVDVADTVPAKAQGLSGRESLAAGQGMLFVFDPPEPQTFWMHAMKISIDIIWIRDGVVVGLEQGAPIPKGFDVATFSSPGAISHVLELAAGAVATNGIQVGDAVKISGYNK